MTKLPANSAITPIVTLPARKPGESDGAYALRLALAQSRYGHAGTVAQAVRVYPA